MSRCLMSKFHRDRFSTVCECERILVEHMDGCHVAFEASPHSRRRRFLRLLVDREFLTFEETGRATVITELGRMALAEFLADHAERLIAASAARHREAA